MDTFLALNSLVCTCDTDKNAKLDKNELGTPKGEIIQSWVLGKILSNFEFNYLDKNNDGFIDIQEFNQALASFGYGSTTQSTTTTTSATSQNSSLGNFQPTLSNLFTFLSPSKRVCLQQGKK